MSAYVVAPWTDDAYFDTGLFINDVERAVNFLDAIIEINNHPLEVQNEVDKYGRKIGIGILGLGDTLAMMGCEYGSEEANNCISEIMWHKNATEVKESWRLAKVLSPCPALSTDEAVEKFWAQPFMQSVDVASEVRNQPLRNYGLSTVAPTGTGAIVAGNKTSGIEPVFAIKYERRSRLNPDQPVTIWHEPLLKHCIDNNIDITKMSDEEVAKQFNYVPAYKVDWKSRIDTQATIQEHITDSISSTVNLPSTATAEEVHDIYMYAWERGLKGVTVYRDGSLEGVLKEVPSDSEDEPGVTPSDDKEQFAGPNSNVYVDTSEIPHYQRTERSLPDVAKATRHRVVWKKAKVYLTVVHDDNGQPLEVFSHLPMEAGYMTDNFGRVTGDFDQSIFLERQSYWHGICRLVSSGLRYGVPLEEICKCLEKSAYGITHLTAILRRVLAGYQSVSSDESGVKFSVDPYGHTLELNEDDIEKALGASGSLYSNSPAGSLSSGTGALYSNSPAGSLCPECGKFTVVKTGGCEQCTECGYTKCG